MPCPVPPISFWLAALPLLLGMACQPAAPEPLQTNFYHWESTLVLDSTARQMLEETGSTRLYVKAFDVAWENGRAEPTALLTARDSAGLPPLIPVVFLTNEVLQQLPASEIPRLAQDILRLLDRILAPGYAELQMDCDWTARTQVQYFALLRAVEELRPGLLLTCTVRLHQYRDRSSQGIPPVRRATLMAYNTGDLDDWATENSILDTNILKGYLAGQPAYPLPLDLAVAVYDWAAVYRQDQLVYLLNEPDLTQLADTSRFVRLSPTRYAVKSSTYLGGLYLYRGDLLRYEALSPASLVSQTALLRRYVASFPGQQQLIFRIGSRQWRKPPE
ncbi:hypothetical protein QWY85_07040 [Neolewinella lacunae]|uniref:Lipoprotein n=1 Tax=Neolewinella lacunae TaxID=1517758 RepID=A0A923PIN5_9BACT|nr:hypothetical protein [Neolewinella lacunae]MBC6994785.1 hypothetical protein [Neolewinella lacunae]MDN3634407.1 hypothetical protein [Neolewinella lacunae]